MTQEDTQAPVNFWGEHPATEAEYYAAHGAEGESSYFSTPDDAGARRLFTRSWRPAGGGAGARPRALVFMVHGYGNDISWTFQATAVFLARSGFACFAADLPGHGRSHGLQAFVPDLEVAVADLLAFFRISDRIRPRWPVPEILTLVSRFAPTLPIVPTADLIEKSVKVPAKRLIAARNPMRYNGRPRLGTVMELLRATDELGARLGEVTIPFLVVHGSADEGTDPAVSGALYEAAASEDKTIKMYDGMLHSMLFGEPEENIERVRGDILAWLSERCTPAATS
uniref:Serine aminopeptidase S33 domain-containing protein n=1 Tax=Aegilops tauschii TaxID=37682 RepID=M8CDL9_AEGTA